MEYVLFIMPDAKDEPPFRGTPFFDMIEDWYETFDLGNIVPRDEVLLKKSMKDALLQNPVFTVLHENERFIHLVNRLGE